jgi:outer membrane factor, OMF family
MLVLRHLAGVSATTAIALLWGVSTTAQTTSPPQSKFEKLSQVEQRSRNLAQTNQQPSSEPPASETVPQLEQTQPAPLSPREQNEPAPENLNPSANPLLFPTQPEEVEIENARAITLNQAVELALDNNRDLQAARISLEQRQAELDEARGALYPQLSTGVQFDRSGQTGNIDRTPEQTNPFTGQTIPEQDQRQELNTSTNFSGNVELSYDIYTGGRRGASIKRARREYRRQQLEVERIVEETRFNATDNYYALQNADAQVAIAQAAVEDATQSLRDARLLEQAGLGTRFSVLQAEVDLASARQDLTSSISQQRISRRQLAQTLSINQQAELSAADEIQEAGSWELSLEESIVQAYKNRAELEQQLVQREIGEQDRAIALADIKPQVQFFAQYQLADNFDDGFDSTDGYALGARMNWLLFDGGRSFARARQADRNIDLANNEFARQRDAVRFQVEQAYYNLTSNQENIQTTRLNVQRAEEALRLARLRFQAGVGTQTDVINSQRDLTEARSEFLQAIIGYNQSLNSLQRAISNQPDNRLFEFR